MPTLRLSTLIHAPIERVFDLSRNLNLHAISMQHTSEKAISGKTSGLIEEGETVIWQARHLFKTRMLAVKITLMQPYSLFIDEMVTGDFRMMKHEHHFESKGNETIMRDVFSFVSPYGILGKMVNRIFLNNYMHRLLKQRNSIIKEYAETDKWKVF